MDDSKIALSNLIKAAKDLKVLAAIVAIFAIIYMAGYETVWVNSWKEIDQVSATVEQQQSILTEKEAKVAQYTKWESELQEFDNSVIKLEQSTSSQSASVKHSRRVEELARGSSESTLPEPHNKRSVISNKLDRYITYKIPEGAPGTEMGNTTTQIEFERYDYTIEVQGTYPGLLDFVNQLALLKPLVAINSIEIIAAEGTNLASRPDPELNPDFPLRLKMMMEYSIFLQDT